MSLLSVEANGRRTSTEAHWWKKVFSKPALKRGYALVGRPGRLGDRGRLLRPAGDEIAHHGHAETGGTPRGRERAGSCWEDRPQRWVVVDAEEEPTEPIASGKADDRGPGNR